MNTKATSRKANTLLPVPASPDGKPVIGFTRAALFEGGLEKHHVTHAGFWMRIDKKASGRPTLTCAEALDVALCYGWIDGQRRTGDAESWLQKFTRRDQRSIWSKINAGPVERSTSESQAGSRSMGAWRRCAATICTAAGCRGWPQANSTAPAA